MTAMTRGVAPLTTLTLFILLALPFAPGKAAEAAAQSATATRTGTEAPRVAEMVPEGAREFDFELSIRNMMRGPEVVGESPVGISWTDDSRWLYFRWRPAGGSWSDSRDLYRVPAGGGEPEKVSDEVADSMAVFLSGGDLSRDRRYRVTTREGDLYLVDRGAMTARRLTSTTASAGSPAFSRDGREIFFTQDNNLFALELARGGIRQLTDFRTGNAPRAPEEPKGQRAFLDAQQRELFEHVQRRIADREERDEARKEREARSLTPIFLGRERVVSLSANASGSHVAVTVVEPAEAKSTIVPDWVTEAGYTENLNTRSKVGDDQSRTRVGVLAVESGEVKWLEPWPSGTAGEGKSLPGATFRGWNDAGTRAIVYSRTRDNKTRWIYSLDATSGELTLLEALFDEAWTGGPCSFCAGWLPDSDRAWFVSEATGYAHLYAINANGTDPRQLTSGAWEVHSVEIPEERTHFYLRTNEGTPFEQHVYRMGFDGSAKVRLTQGTGNFNATPSPDGRRLAIVHSKANRPPELYVARNGTGVTMEQVTVSPAAEWLTFPWIEPEIIQVPAEDGTLVPARIYRPSDMGVEANGAAVIFVHGAGYLQNVHNWWSNYYREYMFHHFLAAQGYTVLDIDYRGSAGYGRDWRTAIYRWMGGKDLSDHVDGARYLAANEGVDPGRVGIYGGSYGGFITLMALFTAPDYFHAGGALRSVTDWAHYNHGYTSNILNLPHEDEEAYRKSSPIYFAENFRGHLLIAHGMVDVNVHFSDVVRLSQRLIELGKENWEMAVYPVEDHGFVEPSSWTDEYRRIFELFERTLR